MPRSLAPVVSPFRLVFDAPETSVSIVRGRA